MEHLFVMVSGTVKIWWRLDNSLCVDVIRDEVFDKKDTGISIEEFDPVSPGIFKLIYESLKDSQFFSGFAGGSVVKLGVGDIIEAGNVGVIPHLGLLIDFDNLDRIARCRPSSWVKVENNLAIMNTWSANTISVIF